jgi:flavin reductase (DIM6/NTAB) family NADH-FMN oxidoreductase RutF
VQVVVRPVRYTYEFMERYATFTLCAFPPEYHSALQILGNRSGRDGDKILASGLTPVSSTRIPAPSYAQASLVLECRKMYWGDFNPAHFTEPDIEKNYPQKDYHRFYFGEILTILSEGA